MVQPREILCIGREVVRIQVGMLLIWKVVLTLAEAFPIRKVVKEEEKKQRQRKTQEIKLYTTSIVRGSYTGAPNGGEMQKVQGEKEQEQV